MATKGEELAQKLRRGRKPKETPEPATQPEESPDFMFLTAEHGAEPEAMAKQAGITDNALKEWFGDSLYNLPDSMFETVFGWLADLIARSEE